MAQHQSSDSEADGSANPLQRGLAKIADRLGIEVEDAVEVRIDNVDVDQLTQLRDAIENSQQLKISYYSMGRDDYSERIIEPYSLRSAEGNWYLSAWCRSAEGPRLFRVDRIDTVTSTGTTFEPNNEIDDTVFGSADALPKVVLDIDPEARWVIDFFPVVATEPQANGRLLVSMAISGAAFIERLLLQLGPQARIASIDAPYPATIGSDAADSVLRRYHR